MFKWFTGKKGKNEKKTKESINQNTSQGKSSQFIVPSIKKATELEKLDEESAVVANFQEFQDQKNLFILGEPGIGKSNFLREYKKHLAKEGYNAFLVELKDVKSTLGNFAINSLSLFPDTDDYLLLDALDEVSPQKFINVAKEIKELLAQFPKIHLCISCRTHHILREGKPNFFSEVEFTYIELQPFSNQQIELFLSLTEDNISKFRASPQFKSNHRNKIISIPRYLTYMSNLIEEDGLADVLALNKWDLFEKFVLYGIKSEEKHEKFDHLRELFLIVLEQLALVLEIHQTNRIRREDVPTFLNDIHSNMNIALVSSDKLMHKFLDGTLIKANLDHLEFHDTEIQEFLAARHIARMGRIEQSVFDLAINNRLQDLMPSWENVLEFLSIKKPELVLPIIQFLTVKNHSDPTSVSSRFLRHFDSTNEDSEKIFGILLDYHLGKELYFYSSMTYENYTNYIAGLFNPKLYSIISKWLENPDLTYRRKSILTKLIIELFNLDKLGEKEKNAWLKIAVENSIHPVENEDILQNDSIRLIEIGNKFSLFKKVIETITKEDRKKLLSSLVLAAQNIDVHQTESIDLFIEYIKTNQFHIHKPLLKVKSSKYVFYLWEKISSDRDLIGKISQDLDYLSLIETLKDGWDESLKEPIFKFIKENCKGRIYRNVQFTDSLIKSLAEIYPNLFFDLIDEIDDKSLEESFTSIELLEPIFKLDYLPRILEENLNFQYPTLIFNLIFSSKETSAQSLAEKYFPELFKSRIKNIIEFENENKKWEKKRNEDYKRRQITLRDTFVQLLELENLDVLPFLAQNRGLLEETITKQEYTKLSSISEKVFESYDPMDFELTVKRIDHRSSRISTSSVIAVFRSILILDQLLKFDYSKFRIKIFKFLPFIIGTDQMEKVLSILGTPSSQEIEILTTFYEQEREDDLKEYGMNKLISLVEEHKIVQLIPILKKFLEENKESYLASRTINIIHELNYDHEYFLDLFQKFESTDSSLASLINAHIIDKSQDLGSIRWRLDLIKREIKIREYTFGSGTRIYSGNEIIKRDSVSILRNTRHPNLKTDYLSLLKFSFEHLSKDTRFLAYCSEVIWPTIDNYITNLFPTRDLSYIYEVESLHTKFNDIRILSSFNNYISKWRRGFVDLISRPLNISDSVKRLNQIKSRQYLDLSTSEELFRLLIRIINTELRNWVEAGAYSYLNRISRKQEDTIQKTIVPQLKFLLLKEGIRDIDIYREVESDDGKRIDLLISYGGIAPIVVEIKRRANDDLKETNRKDYKTKLVHYMKSVNSDRCIYLIFDDTGGDEFFKLIDQVKKEYEKNIGSDREIRVLGIDCKPE
ncbi:MAG: hypothetical protein R8P61_22490 [Bacteroidia bacterium]|nr:hypothetical protein [Bacteroidia bacterium]